jgi:hypothetical protein
MTIHTTVDSKPDTVAWVDAAWGGTEVGSSTQPYATIAAAITAAAANDIIKIKPGAYVEDLAFAAGEDLTLTAMSPGSVTITGSMTITDATVQLEGLNLIDDGAGIALHFTGTLADTLTMIGCVVDSTAGGGVTFSMDNTAGTVICLRSNINGDVGNANEVIQCESGTLDIRDTDVTHGSNVAEALVAEGDAATSILAVDCRFQGSVSAEAAVVAPAAYVLENCVFTVGAISAVIAAATTTIVVDGGTITSTDAGNDAIDGAGTLTIGKDIAFIAAADEVATTLTVTHLLGPKIQHGRYTEAAGAGVRAITLPQVMPSVNYTVVLGYVDTGGGVNASSLEVDTIATTGFNLTTQVNGVYTWCAIHD